MGSRPALISAESRLWTYGLIAFEAKVLSLSSDLEPLYSSLSPFSNLTLADPWSECRSGLHFDGGEALDAVPCTNCPMGIAVDSDNVELILQFLRQLVIGYRQSSLVAYTYSA
jgi:hypothetical protein